MGSLASSLRQTGSAFGAGLKPCIGLSARPDGLTLAHPQFTKKQLKFKVFETAPLNYSDPTERGGLAPMVKQLLPLTRPARGVKNDVAVCLPTSMLSVHGVSAEYVTPKELAEAKEEGIEDFYRDLDETLELPQGMRLSHQVIDNNKKLDEFTAQLAWVDAKAADQHVKMYREAGLNPVVVDVEILAVANFWAAQQGKDPFLRPVGFLEIGEEASYLLVVRRDTWIIREVAVHASDRVLLTQAASMPNRPTGEFWDEVFGRISDSLDSVLAEVKEWPGQSALSELVVYGHGVDPEALTDYMREEREWPANALELDDRYTLDKTGQSGMRDVAGWGQVASAIGAGLRSMNPYGAKQTLPFQANFLGDFEEIADSRAVVGFAKGMRNLALFVLVLWLGYAGAFLMPAVLGGGIGQTLAAAQDALSQQQVLGGGIKKQVTQAEAELAALGDGPKGDTSRLNRFWNQLPEWVPSGTRLLRAAYQAPGTEEGARGRFQIEAISVDQTEVQRFRDSLRASGLLQESGEPQITNDVGGLRVTLLLEVLQ